MDILQIGKPGSPYHYGNRDTCINGANRGIVEGRGVEKRVLSSSWGVVRVLGKDLRTGVGSAGLFSQPAGCVIKKPTEQKLFKN